MNADETEIHEFLKTFRNNFVSVTEISKRLGSRGRFDHDRTWARPILRRMEMDGTLESNPFGEYRIRGLDADSPSFKEGLTRPGVQLGDTTIITLQDVEGADSM